LGAEVVTSYSEIQNLNNLLVFKIEVFLLYLKKNLDNFVDYGILKMDFEEREFKENPRVVHMSDNCAVDFGGFTEDFAELQRVYLLTAARLFLDSDEPIYTEFNMQIFTKAWHQTRFYEILWGRNSQQEKAAFLTEIYETLIENINKYIYQINDKTIADKDPLFQKLTCRKVNGLLHDDSSLMTHRLSI